MEPAEGATAAAAREAVRALDPVGLVLGLGAVAGLALALSWYGVPLHPAQQSTALALLLLFVVCVAHAPVNGLVLLFLVPPLFNGEDQRPYFWLLEVLVYLTLAAGLGAHLWRGRRLRFPYAPLAVFFLVSTIASLPLALKELGAELQVMSWLDLLASVRSADLYEKPFYVRVVLNVANGIGLYVLAVNHRWSRAYLIRLAAAAGLLYLAVVLVGLWRHWAPSPVEAFLSVGIGRKTSAGFGGLGFNVSYFAQYALAYLPLAGLVLTEAAPRWMKAVALGGLLLSAYAVLATGQRAAYLLFPVALGLMLVAARLGRRGGARSSHPGTLPLAVATVLLLALGLYFLAPLRSAVEERFALLFVGGDPYRSAVLRAAWRMFLDEPLLGIGSGQFASVYPRHDPNPAMRVGSLSAHNLYAQLLSEEGLLGLGSFLALVASVTYAAFLAARRSLDPRPPAFYFLASLACWLLYGLLQYTFLMRSMQIYFWIILGLLASAVSTGPSRAKVPRWALSAAAVALGVLVALRVEAAARRPIPAGYTGGFHGREGAERWTRGGAVLNLSVRGKVLRLSFNCPIPQVVGRPQWVTVLLAGRSVSDVVLDSPLSWKVVDLPVDREAGDPVLVQIRVAYTFVPAALHLNPDTRRLGVLMRPPSWLGAAAAP